MDKKSKALSLLILSFLVFNLLFQKAYADIGPKPSMDFYFAYKTLKQVSIVSGEQIECEDRLCLKSHPLERLGPQHFSCEKKDSCSSMAYGYSPYQKLKITFSDKTRESNIFESGSFNSKFYVTVEENSLNVQKTSATIPTLPKITQFFLAFFTTLIIEIFASLVFLSITKTKKKILIYVLLANIISIPIVWFLFGLLKPSLFTAFFSEIFAIVFEASFIYFLNKKINSFKKALLLSVIINIASLIIGGIFLVFLGYLI